MKSGFIRFIHNQKIIEINNVDTNETLLNYIREKLKKSGTKEGCAEGGCGACTVVLGELNNNKIQYRAINSCLLFLPMINGKQLILVEDLVSKNNILHPVQEAMLNFHGSQCGFCTPGFVMSLFAMYKNNFSYNDDIIKDSIAGNLCRCTGYLPIIKAAKSLNGKNKNDKFSKEINTTINLLKKIKNKIPMNIQYNNKNFYVPLNLKQLKQLLKNYPNSTILAGGTDLSLIVTKERKDIKSIIYIGLINELNYIKNKLKYIEVGSATPLIYFENYIKKYYLDFFEILKRYGSVPIRNLATIGGNLGTASPIGDTLPILLSLNAKIIICNHKKEITLSLNNFFVNYRKTKLKKGEFIKSILIPISNNIFKAYKISKRIDDDISAVCGAFNIEIKNNIIKKIIIAYGGMSEIPKRAINCEKRLINKNLSKNIILSAQNFLEKDFNPIDDMRASSKYRMEVAKNLLFKCFLEIIENKKIRINE